MENLFSGTDSETILSWFPRIGKLFRTYIDAAILFAAIEYRYIADNCEHLFFSINYFSLKEYNLAAQSNLQSCVNEKQVLRDTKKEIFWGEDMRDESAQITSGIVSVNLY